MQYQRWKDLFDQHNSIDESIQLIDKQIATLRSLHWRELNLQDGWLRIASLKIQRRNLINSKQNIEAQLWEASYD